MEVKVREDDGVSVAVIQGRAPDLSDYELIRSASLAVHVLEMPSNHNDLSFLLPVADVVSDLTVTDLACTDASAVEIMTNLEQLSLWIDARKEVDLGGLPALVSFAGRWKGARSIIRSLSLRRLFLTAPDPEALPMLQASLSELTLTSASRLGAVPRIEASPDLARLTVHGARTLDLEPLKFYERLHHLHLESCHSLSNAATLLSLSSLESVYLEKCPRIDEWESLEMLQSASIRIVDRNPFDAEFRTLVHPRGTWKFPPGKAYLPPGRHG